MYYIWYKNTSFGFCLSITLDLDFFLPLSPLSQSLLLLSFITRYQHETLDEGRKTRRHQREENDEARIQERSKVQTPRVSSLKDNFNFAPQSILPFNLILPHSSYDIITKR